MRARSSHPDLHGLGWVAGCGVLIPLLGLWLWWGMPAAAASRHADPRPALATGMLLVAARDMGDPRFAKTVVLIVDHDQGGTLGLVLNRRSEVRLGELVSELAGQDGVGHRVYAGGPVGMDQILFLVRHPTQPDHAVRVMADVYVSGALRTLEVMLAAGKTPQELHAYLGSAGWLPGQLAAEVERGDWHVAPGTVQDVFAEYPQALWARRIQAFEPEGLQARGRLPVPAPESTPRCAVVWPAAFGLRRLAGDSQPLVATVQPASQVIGIVAREA